MKQLVKYLGIIIILIGVAILAIPQFMGVTTNTTLGIGLVVMIIGLIAHIVINRYVEND